MSNQEKTQKTITELLRQFSVIGKDSALEEVQERIKSASTPEIKSALGYLDKLPEDEQKALVQIKERLMDALTL